MFLGIDLGTSALKILLVDADQRVVAEVARPLSVSRPMPLFSEQDPEEWWRATVDCLDELAVGHPAAMADVVGIGLSGQMHGAVSLGADARVLRPCILWNDGRSGEECAELERRCPQLQTITGNLAMPGFTAPKILWVARHEPDIFAATRTVLLPKAYLRFRLSGEFAEDMSDASGTLWLDVEKRAWSEALIAACDLRPGTLPRLVEGSAATGELRADLARRWGMAKPPIIAGGAGDNAASAVGLGAVQTGDGFASLGTSGVLWRTTGSFAPNPARAVHAFCHALPALWHQMGVILSASASLSWWASVNAVSPTMLLAELGQERRRPTGLVFLPYLSGERTPHNDAALRGAFIGLDHTSDRAAMTQAVLEGVAFAFRDCLDAIAEAGPIGTMMVTGGGSQSTAWLAILADTLGMPLAVPAGGPQGAAFGAARLGRMAATGEAVEDVCAKPDIAAMIEPDAQRSSAYAATIACYRALFSATRI